MFLLALVCVSFPVVCVSVSRITQEVMKRFQ